MSEYLTDNINQINNGLLHDIKLSSAKDINVHPGLSNMFNTNQEYGVKGIQEQSGVSETYFSNNNLDAIQGTIRYKIHKHTGQIIDYQSPTQINIVMRSIFLQYGNAVVSSDNILNEVQKLNDMVIEFCVKQINTQLKQYNGYLNKLTTLPVPLEHPKYLNKNNFTYDTSNLMN